MKLSSIGKFVDQPLLINSLHKKMPLILIGGAALMGAQDTLSQPGEKKKTRAIKNAIVLSSVVLASLGATALVRKFNIGAKPSDIKDILKTSKDAVDTFKRQNSLGDSKLSGLLEKAKTKVLNPKETDYVLENTKNLKGKENLTEAIFAKPENLDSKDIIKEIGKLSIMGLAPVVAGVGSGILADKATNTESEVSSANKVKEGVYQFLANIFMCNIGAAGALMAAESLVKNGVIKKLTPFKKTAVIVSGITAVGIVGGSRVANFLGKHILDPFFDKKAHGKKHKNHNADNSHHHHHRIGHHKPKCERKPELLDIALHSDDIATVGVLSGFKWIEPLLPLMYLLSGYRAGFGYRNNIDSEHNHFIGAHKDSHHYHNIDSFVAAMK